MLFKKQGPQRDLEFDDGTESENEDMPMEVDNDHHQNTYNQQQKGILKNSAEVNKALRTKNKRHEPADDLPEYSQIIQKLIVRLTNLTKTKIESNAYCFHEYRLLSIAV